MKLREEDVRGWGAEMENVLWPKYIGYTYMKFSKNRENVFLKDSNKFKNEWEKGLYTLLMRE